MELRIELHSILIEIYKTWPPFSDHRSIVLNHTLSPLITAQLPWHSGTQIVFNSAWHLRKQLSLNPRPVMNLARGNLGLRVDSLVSQHKLGQFWWRHFSLFPQTALSYICSTNLTNFLELFLHLPGIDVNKADNEGNTPLHFAAQAGKKNSLKL